MSGAAGELIAGRYRIERTLGKGGMGEVLLARDARLDRPLAVKTMLQRDDDTARSRFIEESQITGQLTHPNIISVHELGQDPQTGNLFLAMKLIDGQDLKAIIEGIKAEDEELIELYPLRRILRLFLKVCEAMEYAHGQNIVHRDLKPANIMFGGEEGEDVLVMDWGLARPMAEDAAGRRSSVLTARSQIMSAVRSSADLGGEAGASVSAELTQQGTIVGTPAYMPPEQGDNPATVDGRADVYALGSCLYEVLTLETPYSGSPIKVLNALFKGPPPAPTERAPELDIPPALEAIVLKAMARAPARRYASAKELQRDLTAWLDGEAVSVYKESFRESVRRWAGKRKGLLITAAVSAVIIVASLGGGLVTSRSRAAEARRERARADLASIEADAAAWRSTRLAGLVEVSRMASQSATLGVAFIEGSVRANDSAAILAAYKGARDPLREAVEALRARLEEVEVAASGEERGPSVLAAALARVRDDPASAELKTRLSAELGEGGAALIAAARQPYAELLSRLSAARELVDEAALEALVARFPEQLAGLVEELELGARAELARARASLRMRDPAGAHARLAGLEAEDPALALQIEALEAFLRREPRAVAYEEQARLWTKAIEAERGRSLRQVASLRELVSGRSSTSPEAGTIMRPGWLYMRRAEVLLQLGRFEEAAADYERAVTVSPEDLFIRYSQLRNLTSPFSTDNQFIDSVIEAYERMADPNGTASGASVGRSEGLLIQALLQQWYRNAGTSEESIKRAITEGRVTRRVGLDYLMKASLSDKRTVFTRYYAREVLNQTSFQDTEALGAFSESLLYEPQALKEQIAELEARIADWPAQLEAARAEVDEKRRLHGEASRAYREAEQARIAALRSGVKSSIEATAKAAAEADTARVATRNALLHLEGIIDQYPALIEMARKELPSCETDSRRSEASFLEEAESMARTALRKVPEDARLNYVLGEVLRRRDQPREALPHLRLGARGSLRPLPYVRLAQCCLALGDSALYEEGLAAIRGAMRFDNIAARNTHEVRYELPGGLRPAIPLYHEIAAQLRRKQGKLPEAIAQMARAVELARSWVLNSASSATNKRDMAERRDALLVALADLHLEAGLAAEATLIMQEAAEGTLPGGGPTAASTDARSRLESGR